MQKISLIAQSVLKLSHCENADDNDDNDDDNNDDDNPHPGGIIVRVGRYSVADKKMMMTVIRAIPSSLNLNPQTFCIKFPFIFNQILKSM